MNLRRFFHISKNKSVESEDVEHWVVSWEVYDTGWNASTYKYTKVFLNKDNARAFEDALCAAADLTKAYVKVKVENR